MHRWPAKKGMARGGRTKENQSSGKSSISLQAKKKKNHACEKRWGEGAGSRGSYKRQGEPGSTGKDRGTRKGRKHKMNPGTKRLAIFGKTIRQRSDKERSLKQFKGPLISKTRWNLTPDQGQIELGVLKRKVQVLSEAKSKRVANQRGAFKEASAEIRKFLWGRARSLSFGKGWKAGGRSLYLAQGLMYSIKRSLQTHITLSFL